MEIWKYVAILLGAIVLSYLVFGFMVKQPSPKKFFEWIKARPGWLFAGLGVFIAAVLLTRRKDNNITSLTAALEVEKIRSDIAKKEGQIVQLEKEFGKNEAAIDAARSEIAESKRRVVEINSGTTPEGKTDEQIAEEFSRAGF